MKGEHKAQKTGPAQATPRAVYFIALSQFGMAFCFNVVMSFMPFYIIRISPYREAETMVWIGLIMGLNSFVAAAAAPFWGSMTARIRPKALFQGAFLCNGIIFLLMGFASTPPILLVLRLCQGALGAASTIGLFMISRLSPGESLARNLSIYQSSMTAGQLIGPPVGAYLAAHLGYQSPFFFSSLLVAAALILCQIYVPEIEKKEAAAGPKTTFDKNLLWGWVLSFTATIHLIFLPSILPHVLKGFGLAGQEALKAAGFIMMGYTATAIIGSYLISTFAPPKRLAEVITAVCLAAALFQVLLMIPEGVIGFLAVRMLQTGVVAAVIPLVMAAFAGRVGGTGIGFLNSARFAGNGAGPLMATFVVAAGGLDTLYLLISGVTVAAVGAFWLTRLRRRG